MVRSSAGSTGGAGGGYGGAGGQGAEDGNNPSGFGGQPYGNQETPNLLGSAGGSGGVASNFQKSWTLNADFNQGTFTSGMQNPTNNNELKLSQQTSSSINTGAISGYVSSGLIGDWKMDESSGSGVSDTSGSNNSGTATGTSVVTGVKQNARSFNGTSDYVEVADSNSLDLSQFTLETWIKVNSLPSAQASLISKNPNNNNQTNYNLWVLSDGTIALQAGNGGGSNFSAINLNSNTKVVIGQWYHIVGSISGTDGTAKIYINGVLDVATTVSGTAYSNNNVLSIGARKWDDGGSGIDNYFNGTIDEVKIYNRALSQSEVNQNYNYGSFSGYWKLDESLWNGTSGEVADSSGDNVNGTAQNGATTTTGQFNNAGNFGSGGYVSLGDNDNFTPSANGFTASAWVNFNSFQTGGSQVRAPILTKNSYDGSGQWEWSLGAFNYASTSNPVFTMITTSTGGGTLSQASDSNPVNINTWYFVTGTVDSNGKTSIYVNGLLVAQGSNASFPSNTSEPLKIGTEYGSGVRWDLNGKVDEARIYNRALSASEISSLYTTTNNYFPRLLHH